MTEGACRGADEGRFEGVGVADPRTRHLRRLQALRRSARRGSITAGTLVGAAVVLIPYRGLGWPDAIWAALAGGSVVRTWWRWRDLREMSALPVPDEGLPGSGRPLESLFAKLPVGRTAIAELQRAQARTRVRGTSVLPAWTRLDAATKALAGLAPRLQGSAAEAVRDASYAERGLRELGERTAAVERATAIVPADSALAGAHQELLDHFTRGVGAYEALVAAAAGCVAQDGTAARKDGAVVRLAEATDLLSGIAAGLSELRAPGTA